MLGTKTKDHVMKQRGPGLHGDEQALRHERAKEFGGPYCARKAVDRVSLYVKNGREALQTLEREGVSLNGAYVRPGNLEDVFLKLTGRSLRDD